MKREMRNLKMELMNSCFHTSNFKFLILSKLSVKVTIIEIFL